MQTTSASITALIEELAKLPGIGPKSAQRLTFYILRSPADQARRLAEAITRVKENAIQCSVCCNITESDPCPICASPERDHGLICVVEQPLDVLALEKTGALKGVYHVLHGALSPLEGIGPRDLKIDELAARVRAGASAEGEPVREVILATNPNQEGDYTATYIAQAIARPGLLLTRLARGLPIGGDLEYADEGTLSRALEGRREL
ncbi:MAG: recombination mediator RecR [Alphaproteobacteria bacterium]|nr:recombination mediator RecR [Alphaproteobacteria bacterium]